ncbi:hypothetical protein ACP4OV_006849 [Aristida adscensionis]
MAAMASSVSASATFAARPGGAGSARPVAARAGEGKWWAPLLGWSGRADYLEAPAPVEGKAESAARRAFVGGLTEEKARELRARMLETESFHDAMYHSAIASRLARSA